MNLLGGNSAGAAPSAGPDLSTPEQKKRNRIRFSCTTCREKKLKCNRQTPCDQCEKRGLTSTCQIVPYNNPRPGQPRPANTADTTPAVSAQSGVAPRPRPSANDATLQGRLKHLERLVHVLKAQQKTIPNPNPDAEPEEIHDFNLKPGLCVTRIAGSIINDQKYVNSANWESILEDITKLTKDLMTYDDTAGDQADAPDAPSTESRRGMVLLSGGFPRISVAEMVARLPPRYVTDRLIARFFHTKEPAWMVFHVPTFQKRYEQFWETPTEFSYTWISLVFFMMAYGALFCARGDDDVPGNLGPALEVFETFKMHGAQCLALDDYTTPGCTKIEALLLYFGCEYLARSDAVMGTSIILGTLMRLAMHSGLHRDPKHYPEISPYDGEMRRRLWTLLVEIDQLVSFQFGLPSNVHSRFFDTEPPRNLHDDEFDESTTVLPPSRPETERTVTLYIIVKSRLMRVFEDITSAISSREQQSYDELMRLDKQLEGVHSSFPPLLRYRPLNQSLVDPTDLIMQRYWLELLYQKSRSVLHRRYMGLGRMVQRYGHSRRTCLDAATQIMKHQYDIHCEIYPGGRLAKERWFMSSLSVHDFLLANMILCLELSYLNAQSNSPDASAAAVKEFARDTSTEIMTKDQLMDILRTSRNIWQLMRADSAEANRGFKILSKMLSVSTGDVFESSPDSMDNAMENVDMIAAPPTTTGSSGDFQAQENSNTTSPWGTFTGTATGQDNGQLAPTSWAADGSATGSVNMSSINMIDGLPIDPTLTSDWSLWDNQIQNSNAESLQIPWNTFFQSSQPEPDS
ncbi:hypothetical protein B0T17DRAFT_500453 [Bombardia bombarda]|uniref:Zn(2)-C6 fungal-type domain-containing protein n=1 Tax=Bombardia bombarda TaxID=252184 RepID=A0AA39T167_9PEZI|nr:hypothetical protein B0T17DRAFT_500453 [Bombardia bombarda]